MVVLTKPLHSAEAIGALAKTLVFSTAGGIHQVRKHVKPRNRKSPKQVGVRTMISFLARQWKLLTDDEKESWNEPALAAGLTRFNAYNSYNLKRWGRSRSPAKAFPATQDDDGGNILSSQVLKLPTGLTVFLWIPQPKDTSLITIHRSQETPFNPGYQNCIIAETPVPGTFHFFRDEPLAPGTYYYFAITHTATGLTFDTTAELTGTFP